MKTRRIVLSVLSILVIVMISILPVIPALASSSVLNPGFESGSGTDASNWTEGTSHTRSSEQAHSGNYSLKSAYTGSSTNTEQGSLGGWGTNKTFYISYYAYRINSSGSAYLRLHQYNENVHAEFYTTTTYGAWQRVSGSFFISDSWNLFVELVTVNMSDAVYFDDICVSITASDCAEATATPTSTATSTSTPTETATPTETNTPTETPTTTGTQPSTNTPTETFTPTATYTPGPAIIWADSPVTLSPALLDAIGTLVHDNPPGDAETNVFAITNISGVDTAWNVSVVNLVDVDAPYDVWDQETNVVWAWFVECTGEEPTWTCEYYELPSGGGSTSLRFPWRTGSSAQYGIMGVHAGAKMITGSSAVDFVGHDSGTNVMPGQVVAAASGIITSVCNDGTSMAIRVDGGPVPLGYFHFATGQSFSEGQAITQGQVLGELRHGTFTGSNCGYAVQAAGSYHVHFVFLPTSSGYLEIGGCVLHLSTQAFVCGGNTYTKLSYIPNGGAASNPSNPSDPGSGTNAVGGGVHIWDGIVNAIVQLNVDTVSQYLPVQNPTVGYAIQKVMLVVQALLSIFMIIYSYGFSGALLTIIVITVITLEMAFKVVELAAYLFKQVGWLIKFFI